MQKIAAVDLRQTGLSLCLAESRFRSLRPAGYEDVALPPEAGARNDALAAVLGRLKKEKGAEGLVLGLPLQSFSHQLVDMPSMGRDDMRHALVFELEKYLPLDVDEYYFDFITTPGEKGRTSAVVFAIRKGPVDELLKLARDAGLDIIAVRSSFLAALRGLGGTYSEKELNGIFVHVTADAVEMAGLRNGVPVYMKALPRRTDLLQVIESLSQQYPGRVFFDGSDDSVPGGRLTVTRVHLRIPQLLALSAVRKSRLDLELMPGAGAGRQLDYYPHAIAGIASAALIFHLLTGLLIFYKDYRALRETEAARAAIRSRAAAILESKKKSDLLESDRGLLSDFQRSSTVAARAMSRLSSGLPKEAWLISMTVDDKGRIEVEGFTRRTPALVMDLEKSHLFKNVSYTAPIITKDGEERFALRMEVAALDQ